MYNSSISPTIKESITRDCEIKNHDPASGGRDTA